MRKLILLSAIAAGSLLSTTANAQIGVNIGVNFGGRAPIVHVPVATPPIAYDAYYNDYYYLPDVGAYYSVGEQAYYYNNGGRWISAAYLPGRRNYDWRSARRYEVHANRPYLNHNYYSSRYDVRRNDFNNSRNDYRGNDHFDNRNDNRGNGRFDDRNDNRGRGQGFERNNGPQSPQNNRPQGGFNQPQQGRGDDRGRGNNNGGQQRFTDNNQQGRPTRLGRG